MSTSSLFLGEGAYARVFAKDGSAIKISKIERFEDLISAARELFIIRKGIPGCVPFRSCYFKWQSMHILMEKASSSLREVKISAKIVAIQLLQTMYKMHHLKIMHRDLKPDNILIKGDKIWVCDFGLSRQFCNAEGQSGTPYMFTRWYRAPEVFRKVGYTCKADMWSLGCILHKLVHGDVPGKTLEEILRRVPVLSDDNEMNKLIKNLLRLNPEHRWSAETALKFLKQPRETCEEKYALQAWISGDIRSNWFNMFRGAFPEEHRVLAHGLMLYDKGGQNEESMCCAMALSSMIFKTRPCDIIKFASKKFRTVSSYSFRAFMGKYIPAVCDGELCEWERSELDFDQYIEQRFKGKKRKVI